MSIILHLRYAMFFFLIFPFALYAQVPGQTNIPPRECDCPAMRVTDHWCRASVIFLGKVTAVDTTYAQTEIGKWNRDVIERISAGFIVEHTFKGSTNAMMNINTAMDDRHCGFSFRKGETFLVFAHEENNELVTDRCSGTREGDTVGREFSDSLDYLIEGGTYEIAGKEEPDCNKEKVGKVLEQDDH
ncbi:MAG: hypothetical protein M3R08_05690 [Bacteroidota bacterium]|nr:hypothetical protein [Bacteroidota bacterium]